MYYLSIKMSWTALRYLYNTYDQNVESRWYLHILYLYYFNTAQGSAYLVFLYILPFNVRLCQISDYRIFNNEETTEIIVDILINKPGVIVDNHEVLSHTWELTAAVIVKPK